MSITSQEALDTLENVLFESPTLASANVASYTLSSYASADALARALTQSPEFTVVERVIGYYQASLGRAPSGSEIAFYVNLAENGNAAAGIAAASPSQIAQGAIGIRQATWNQIASYFTASPEFTKDYGLTSAGVVTQNEQSTLVTDLYQNVLGRTPSASETAFYVGYLEQGATPAALMQWFTLSPEFQGDVNSTIQSLIVGYYDSLQGSTATNQTSIGTIPIGPHPTYAITSDGQSFVTEGGTETFTVNTTGVAAGTTFSYNLSGVSATEVIGGHLSGTLTIGSNGSASLVVALTNTPGEGLTGDLTATLSSTSGGTSIASASVPLSETAASSVITTIGTLGGATRVSGINDNGLAVGFSSLGDGGVGPFSTFGGTEHAFFWQGGTTTDLGTLSGYGYASEAWAINSSGEVVGWSVAGSGTALTGGQAFLWDGGTLIELGTLAGGQTSQARAINDVGQIVGQSGGDAFLWNPTTSNATTGTMVDLGRLPGSAGSIATGINPSGEVVGWSATNGSAFQAFLWTPSSANAATGTMISLSSLPGDTNARAFAINATGEVVGTSINGSGNTDSWVWQPNAANGATGKMTQLPSLGGMDAQVSALNAAGIIVGQAETSSGDYHAVLWQNGTAIDLNSYLPANSGWVLTNAVAINDGNVIAGEGTHGGVFSAFELSLPAAAPGAAILLLGVAAAHLGT